ncbi:MAG: GatB/YqeY domain-containing protein [Bacillota bacterium]
MASLKKELVEDMKEAMKNKNEQKIRVIRRIRAIIKNKEIKKQKELSDEEVVEIMANKVSDFQESVNKFQDEGQTEAVSEVKQSIEIITQYLPDNVLSEL